MLAVIDTNVLVSALWKPEGNASLVLSNVISGKIQPCYDDKIIKEYRDVLTRPKFKFSSLQVECLLDIFIQDGLYVIPKPLYDVNFTDDDDRVFYEVAKHCNAPLVSGNLRHFPVDPLVMSLTDFCNIYLKN